MINPHQIAVFHAVVEEGSFSLAAKRLRVTQPAVSIQISQLEQCLGLRLLDRTGRTILLTEAGRALAVYSRRMATLETEAFRAMQDFAQLKRGRLRVGASTTLGAYLLPQLFREYRNRWPEVTLEMTIGNSRQIAERVDDQLVDIGLVEGPVAISTCSVETFREDQLVPIAAWDSPLARSRQLTLRQFAQQPFILREPGSGMREVTLEFLGGRGLSPTIALEVESTTVVKGAVAAGLGVSFVSSLSVAGDVRLRRLRVLRLRDVPVIRRSLSVVLRQQGATSPTTQAFLSILRSH